MDGMLIIDIKVFVYILVDLDVLVQICGDLLKKFLVIHENMEAGFIL